MRASEKSKSSSPQPRIPAITFRISGLGTDPSFEVFHGALAKDLLGRDEIAFSDFLNLLGSFDKQAFLASIHSDHRGIYWSGLINDNQVQMHASKISDPDGSVTLDGIFVRSFPASSPKSQAEAGDKLLGSIIDNIPHSVFWKSAGGVYLGCNKRFLKDANLASPQDLIGKTDFDMPWGKAEAENYRRDDFNLMASRRPRLNFEETQLQADGSVIHVMTSKVPLFNNAGEVTGILGIYSDVTELRNAQADLANQQTKAIELSKLAALGTMAAEIAHEINNPLAIISGLSQALLLESEDGPVPLDQFARKINGIDSSAQRIAKIIRSLRSYSRDERAEEMTEVSIEKIVQETVDLCRGRFKNSNVDLNLGKIPTAKIRCHEGEISQVLLNLLNNALDAAPEAGERWVKLDVTAFQDSVRIVVSDSGRGIPEGLQKKIFEPFFTTKAKGKGTGLGLSISRRIIESHGGTFFYDGSAGFTQFVVQLRRAAEATAA